MRRVVLILAAAAATASLAACGGGDVTVQAQLQNVASDSQATGPVALASLPVRLLPYDRDAIFDSLKQAYPEPEPQIPDSIFALQQRVSQLQQQWQQANNRWLTVRDSLKTLSDKMNQMDKSSGEYFAMFKDFEDLDNQVSRLQRQSDAAFNEFTTLQKRLADESQEIKLQRRAWADEAYAPIDSIITAKLEELGREELADTTDAQGVATFRGVAPGQWWVHGRYDQQFDELYWNEPIQVDRGKETDIRLTEENAEVRQKM